MAETPSFKEILRIASVDIMGKKQLAYGLCKIRGVSFSYAYALCRLTGLSPSMKTGSLTDDQISKLNDALKRPESINMPSFMRNRQKDYTNGEDRHVVGPDRDFTKMNDISRLRKTKTYRGLRHAYKLPTRGQKTRSNFRKGSTLGVKRKKK